ncbi:MAG: hypothetical protein WCX65_15430 [bacterium]
MALLILIPALSVLLWVGIEAPASWRRAFFKIPLIFSCTAIVGIIGLIGRGVLGPTTGFIAELILYPGLLLIRSLSKWGERREARLKDKKQA